MARPRGGPGRKKGSKSKPAKPGKAVAPSAASVPSSAPANPGRLSAAAAFGGGRRAVTPEHVSRSLTPPKPKLVSPGGRGRGAFVDARGRWRDARGHFFARGTLFSGFFPGSFEDVGIYLQDLAARIRQPVGADRQRQYMVVARFLGLPEDRDYRMLSNAQGLKQAVSQAGGNLRFQKRFNRYALAVEGHKGPLVVYELALHELPESKGPRTAKQAMKRTKAKQAKSKPAKGKKGKAKR